MAIIGDLIARSLKIKKRFTRKKDNNLNLQKKTLKKLLEKSKFTAFGKKYNFEEILSQSLDFVADFRKEVPIHNYNSMFEQWWYRCLEGEENVCWPGKVKYFALSSGTSESASKHIPVTSDMIRSIKKVGMKQFYSLTNFDIPSKAFTKGVLMLGGTTKLTAKDDYYVGDMSGISAKNIPRLFSSLMYKPGKKISMTPDWTERIELIVANAPKWDVGTICGVPAWVQIVLEAIISRYNLKDIHEIWPNFSVYIHGGVAFEPYRIPLQKIFGQNVTHIETYMASEGSFGFQARPAVQGIKLELNSGIFYEFVPFNNENFTEDGEIKPEATSKLIHEVQKNEDYAVMISTVSGAWRYIIGDVVRFTSVSEGEIIIVGRTKQFLSLCGEHLSVDNINKTIDILSQETGMDIGEFAVGGYPYQNRFAHTWFIGSNNKDLDLEKIKEIIDRSLCSLNDDYEVERKSALKEVFVKILPKGTFMEYLKFMGKYGAMNKFPRVLKGDQLRDFEGFIKEKGF
ncbi:MAG TPA: GH3 auxin-responsive promoter family protein [Edaphocola sp.]|nr:GH3 auxin-responsive promoter family protein [Edaphocola sp.]